MSTRSNIIAAGQSLFSQKGFAAVGLAEILKAAGVPKGSFYHFFASKDAFGVEMLNDYFQSYHAEMDEMFAKPGLIASERLMLYFSNWRENQGLNDCQGRCLVVKLGAEVADFSEPMRNALQEGTHGIIARLATLIEQGAADGSLRISYPAEVMAANVYSLWIGASIMAKITRLHDPFDKALAETRLVFGLPN